MRDLRNDRARTTGVREERLRAATGADAPALSAWRGHSGRRYVVRVHSLAGADLAEVTNAVIIGVRRRADDIAEIVAVATAGDRPSSSARARWLADLEQKGATELHVHRLAGSQAERHAIVDDLRSDAITTP